MVQIRNVPPELHRALKARAADSGLSLSDYLLQELKVLALRPTMREWAASVRDLSPLDVSKRPVEILHDERQR